MSDMIWNGSYTLGDSQETQITAGTGIKVTTPAAGQIQITTDETVLWTGNNVQPSSTAIEVSEALSKFNSVKFYWSKSNYLGEQVDELSIDGNTTQLGFIHLSGVANMWIQTVSLTLSGTSLTLLWAKNLNFGSVSSTTWSNPTITTTVGDSFQLTKIVGINRISGGN